LGENLLDLRGVLHQEKYAHRLYYKTDTHWNTYGAYIGYQAIIERLQRWYPDIRPVSFEQLALFRDRTKSGDLAGLMGLPGIVKEKVDEWLVRSPCAAGTDRPVVVPGLPRAGTLEKNGCIRGAPLRVLVIADSFGAYLRQYLSETFQEVVYNASFECNELTKFIVAYKPDLIIHLHVARFMEKALVVTPELDKPSAGR
jgi:hypothetical protein